jgi:MOSC domain-containing protein YiiM
VARVEALWIKRMKRGPMDPVHAVRAVSRRGLEDNADQGGRRQVTVIEEEVFRRLAGELPGVEPAMRRANVMVSGVRLERTRDRILHLGNVRLHIRGETRPCHRMDEAHDGLQDALKPAWGGGIYAVVLDDGEIRVGDPVRLEEGEPGDAGT